MKSFVSKYCSTILIISIFAMLASSAFAQRGRSRGRRQNLTITLVSLPNVHRELQISSEQDKLLEALRTDLSTQNRRRERESENESEQVASKLFASVLNKKQMSRMTEIRLQYEALRAFEDTALREKLKVTDDQRNTIRAIAREPQPDDFDPNEVLEDILKKEQYKQWQAMAGEPFEFSERTNRMRNFMRRLRGRR